MNVPREIEAKYIVSDPGLFADLMALAQVGVFSLRPELAVIDQINTYFDTSDRRLGAERYGFRIRLAEGQIVATLKGPATIQDDIHTRNEWEIDLDQPNPNSIPHGELRDRLLVVTQEQPLFPLLTIHTKRQIIVAARDQRLVAEIALDDYVIMANTRQEQHYELELELLPSGQATDLKELAVLLRDRYHVVPNSRSKLERGLALLEGSL